MDFSQIIISPIMTEKSVRQESGNKYTFVVHDSANKVEIKNALTSLYGVEVAKVNVLHTLPKYRVGRGKHPIEKRQGVRKAVVTLREGSKLDLTREKKTSKPKAATASK